MTSSWRHRLGQVLRPPRAAGDGVRGRSSSYDAATDADSLLRLLPSRGRPARVSVVLDRADAGYGDLLSALAARSRLLVFLPEGAGPGPGGIRTRRFAGLDQLDALLRRRPARDLFVDLRRVPAEDQRALWRKAYFHVLDRGAYVHARPASGALPDWPDRAVRGPERARTGAADVDDLAASTRWVRSLALESGELVAHKKVRRHLLRIRDGSAAPLLARRETGVRVDLLDSVPPETVESRARVRHHGASIRLRVPDDSWTVPELHAWHYRGRIALDSHMLAYCGTSVLPASFRLPGQRNLNNVRLAPVDPTGWARLRRSVRPPAVTLEGDYFDLNPGYPRMFGHLLTQTVHKLWAWDAAREQLPGLKALVHVPADHEPTLERELLTAYGIPEEDLCFFDEPVFVESYVSPTILWEYTPPYYASPLAVQTWRRLRQGLGVGEAQPRGRIFVSRRGSAYSRRACRNTDAVEDLFREHGFTVVFPEDHSLAGQAALFAGARVIAGFGGSAMFNLMWSTPEQVIVLNHEGYRVRSEHLFAALLGTRIDFFWSTPDVEQPEQGFSRDAFRSEWEFDFARNGVELSALLAGLP